MAIWVMKAWIYKILAPCQCAMRVYVLAVSEWQTVTVAALTGQWVLAQDWLGCTEDIALHPDSANTRKKETKRNTPGRKKNTR